MIESGEELEALVATRTRELSEATATLQAVIDASPVAIVTTSIDGLVETWNPAAERIFGWRRDEVTGQRSRLVPDEIWPVHRTMLDELFAGNAPAPHESVRRRADGQTIDVTVFAAALRRADGSVRGALEMLQDITHRRELEREREALLRRLVDAREAERQRIARELHDEMGQHIAALKIMVESISGSSPGAVSRLKEIANSVDSSIDRLMLELRAPALDDLGLDPAIRQLAEQFATRTRVPVDLHISGLERPLGAEREQALFRIAQEALSNVAKHARAARVSIVIQVAGGQLQMVVEDDGAGFELPPDGSGGYTHFGIVGMTERAELTGGTLSIESEPGGGTAVYVRMPIADEQGA